MNLKKQIKEIKTELSIMNDCLTYFETAVYFPSKSDVNHLNSILKASKPNLHTFRNLMILARNYNRNFNDNENRTMNAESSF